MTNSELTIGTKVQAPIVGTRRTAEATVTGFARYGLVEVAYTDIHEGGTLYPQSFRRSALRVVE
jgi:hypothetical protein